MKNKNIYFSAVLSGLLLFLAFPPMPLYILAFIGFIPLLYILESRINGKVFLVLYLTFFVFNLGTTWWIGSWQANSDPFLMISGVVLVFVHPFFFLVPMYIYISIRKKFGRDLALWLFPFIWIAFEWGHSLSDLSYPWLTIGYTQIYNTYFAQIADIAGVYGISFIIVFVNILILKIFFLFKDARQNLILNIWKVSKTKNYLILLILSIVIPYIYGVIRYQKIENDRSKSDKMRIGILQTNINPWDKWQKSVGSQISSFLSLEDSLTNSVDNLDLIIYPETAIPFMDFRLNSDHKFNFFQSRANKYDYSILSGFADIYLYKKNDKIPKTAKLLDSASGQYYDSYNAAIMINPKPYDTIEPKIYHKMKLTPFSERMPFAEYLTFASDLIKWGVGISSWQKGKHQHTLKMTNHKKSINIGTVICIESIYPNFVRNFAKEKAQMLVVITNDAWYDHTPGPVQHFIISQMRAIETRRYIIRCANSGISGFIKPNGNILSLAPQYKTIGIYKDIPTNYYYSLYVELGDWLPIAGSLISIFFLFTSILRRKTK